jgi:hypothetical protein
MLTIPVMVTAKKPQPQAETYSVSFTDAIEGVAVLKGLSGGRSLQGTADLTFINVVEDGWKSNGNDWSGLHEDGILVIRIKKGTGNAEIIYDFDRKPWPSNNKLKVPTYGLRGTGIWQEGDASFPAGIVTFAGPVVLYLIEASALTKKGGLSLTYTHIATLSDVAFEAHIAS